MLLSATNISMSFAGDDGETITPLNNIDLLVEKGDVIDIVGTSGSGKSTLLGALARLLPGAQATLTLNGKPASEFTPQEWRTLVTLLPQKPQLVGATVEEALVLPWTFKALATRVPQKPSENTLRDMLDAAALESVALDRPCENLSVGQQSRIAFIRSVLIEPEILLLDEAEAALDNDSSARITQLTREFVTRGDCAVVRVRHRKPDYLASCRYRLEDGHLIRQELTAGAPEESEHTEEREGERG